MTVYERIYGVIRRVPPGTVATYGQIAALAKAAGARQIGYALHSLPDGGDVPWHRVINSEGRVSERSAPGAHNLQRSLLEAEGIEFDTRGRIDLERFQWDE